MMYSLYYQAYVLREMTWLFVATLRSFENLCFDRALDKHTGLFEFYITPHQEQEFLELMQYYEQQHIVKGLIKMDNRLIKETIL